jgi:hypothetical protein
MKLRVRSEGGMVLVISLIFVLILAIGAAAFLNLVKTQIVQVKLQLHSTKAFFAAEAGLERGMQLLKDDLYYTPDEMKPSWADNKIFTATGYIDLAPRGYPRYLSLENPDYDGEFYSLIAETDYNLEGNGNYKSTYQVDLSNLQGWTDRVWVKTTGRYYRRNPDGVGFSMEAQRRILVQLGAAEISPWNYAIFANTGQNGRVINGNVDIRGSVHILGNGLGTNDLAAEFSGTGDIGNNYVGIPSDLGVRLPSIAKVYGNETLDSLETEVSIKHGKLSLSGHSYVGAPDVQGNAVKETIAGVYITDGYAGNQGDRNVYSDNGTGNPYDFGDFDVGFPFLTKPWSIYNNYLEEFIRPNALVISGEDALNLKRITPKSSFSYSDGNGEISMNGNGVLTIDGMVLIEGDVTFDKAGNKKEIQYNGKGSLTTTGSVKINCSLLTWSFTGYPQDHILGIMAVDTITFNSAGIDVMGVFYAENQIVSQKQTNVAGTFVSNYFDMGKNVPSIYQVPETVYNLPSGMIGNIRVWALRRVAWHEI